MRIHQRAVLGPAFDEAAALRVMHTTRVAVIGARENAALAVKINTPRIAAALGEYFKALGRWMIPPNRTAPTG